MIAFFMTFLGLATSVMKIKDLSPEYILYKEESYSVPLNDIFSGDNLIYLISPQNNTILQSCSSSVQLTTSKSDFSSPDRIITIQSLDNDTTSNQLFLYQAIDRISIIYLNLQLQIPFSLSTSKFFLVHSAQYYQLFPNSGVFLIEAEIIYKLYFIPIEFDFPIIKFSTPIHQDMDFENFHLPRLVEGPITDSLLITGYRGTNAALIFYNVTDPTNISLLQEMELSYQASELREIFSVSNGEQFFVIIPCASEIIRIDWNDYGFYISNALKLPYFEKNVTSFKVNLFKRYLTVGLVDGFVVTSFDFQQVYVKQEQKIFFNSYMSYTEFNDYVLTERKDSYLLVELGVNFEITGNASFPKSSHGLNWAVFSYYKSNCVFVRGQNDSIDIFNVTLTYPKLTFKSSGNIVSYNLTAIQEYPLKYIMTSFKVSRPEQDTPGYIQPYLQNVIKVYFVNFTAYISVPIQSYVIGGNISIINCDLDHPSHFTSSIEIIENFYKMLEIDVGPNNFTHILGGREYISLYNNNNITIYNDTSLVYSFNVSDYLIENLLYCGAGYLLYAEIYLDEFEGIIFYSLNPFFQHGDYFKVIKNPCSRISCSNQYIICQTTIGVYSIRINGNQLGKLVTITNKKIGSDIISSALLQQNYLAVLLSNNNVMIVDLDTIYIFELEIKGQTMQLDYNATKILAYSNLLIVNNDSEVFMYDFYFNYLKTFSVLEEGSLKLYNDYLISYTQSQLLVIDCLQWVTNSTIIDVTIHGWNAFSGYSSDEFPLKLYFLNDTAVSSFIVPPDYNNAKLNITINDTGDISDIEYDATLECLIGNQFNIVNVTIPLNLMVNGETIFRNNTKIKLLQKESMKYQCGQTFTLPLGNIFLGQDLIGNISKTEYVTLAQRFKRIKNLSELYTKDIYTYSSTQQLFAASKDCSIYILSINMTELSNKTFTSNYTLFCQCTSISMLSDSNSLIFVIGCTISQDIIRGIWNIDRFFNILVFASYNYEEIKILQMLQIDYPPQKMKTTTLNGGEFFILTAENFYLVSLSTFYSNHLIVTHGIIEENFVKIFDHSCVFAKLYLLEYYYLSDFDVVFDPLFGIFYIYAVDIYYGLRIVKFDKDFTCSDMGLIEMGGGDIGYSVLVCGQILLIAMKNTDIHIYNLHNWTFPVYQASVLAYTNTFEAVQGSLRCSSDWFPHFAYLEMNQSNTYSVHIVDLQSSNLSNILIDYNLPDSFADPLRLSTFIDPNGTLALINENTKAIYELSPFQLNIDTTKNCKKNSLQPLTITVSNTKSKNSQVTFNLTVKKFYQPSKIYDRTFPFWVLLIMFMVLMAIVLGIYYLLKKCLRKNKVNTAGLFDYQNEFQELTSLNKD